MHISDSCRVFSTNTVTPLVSQLSHAIKQLSEQGSGPLALYVDTSIDGVLLTLAAIRAGASVALCPTREPTPLLNDWFRTLNITMLLCSELSELQAGFHPRIVTKNDLLRLELRKGESFCERNFSSIIRTSGTSSQAKSALISFAAHRESALAVNHELSFGERDCWALNLPLYHVSGLSVLFRALYARASLFVAEKYESLVAAIQNHRVTHVSLVPTQLSRLLDDGIDLSSLKVVVLGGDAVPANLRLRAIRRNVPLYESYGLTETASMIWVRNSRKKAAGKILAHAQMKFSDDNEILVGGKSLFSGYIQKNGTLHNPCVNNFFATGDINLNRDSILEIIARKNNRIISGGENIQAEEIESAVEMFPNINRCVVVSKKDELYGARPVAFIDCQLKSFDECKLRSYLERQLSRFKIPKKIFMWPEAIPRNSSKKPRRELQRLVNHW